MEQMWVIDVQSDKDIPIELYEEVQKLWQDMEYGNDHYYFKWNKWFSEETEGEWPVIKKYLADHDIEECLLRYWW